MPAIVPLVLYNGADNWQAPQQFRHMLTGHSQFGQHLVDFNYILLDINRYQEKDLLAMSGLISSIFLLDRKLRQDIDIIGRLRILMKGLQRLHPDDFQQFTVWLKHVLKPRINRKLHHLSDPKDKIKITSKNSKKQSQLEGTMTMQQNSMVCMIREQPQRALWEVKNVMDCVPDSSWNKLYCEMPLWKHIYHMLHSLDLWYMNPRDINYCEPDFHEEGLNNLNIISHKQCSREDMNLYYQKIKHKIECYVSTQTLQKHCL